MGRSIYQFPPSAAKNLNDRTFPPFRVALSSLCRPQRPQRLRPRPIDSYPRGSVHRGSTAGIFGRRVGSADGLGPRGFTSRVPLIKHGAPSTYLPGRKHSIPSTSKLDSRDGAKSELRDLLVVGEREAWFSIFTAILALRSTLAPTPDSVSVLRWYQTVHLCRHRRQSRAIGELRSGILGKGGVLFQVSRGAQPVGRKGQHGAFRPAFLPHHEPGGRRHERVLPRWCGEPRIGPERWWWMRARETHGPSSSGTFGVAWPLVRLPRLDNRRIDGSLRGGASP